MRIISNPPPLHPWRVRLQHPRILLSTPLMFASNCFKLILGSSVRKKSIQTGLVPKVVLQRKGGGGGNALINRNMPLKCIQLGIRNQGCHLSLSLSPSLSQRKKNSKTFYLCDGSLSGEIFITATTFPLSS